MFAACDDTNVAVSSCTESFWAYTSGSCAIIAIFNSVFSPHKVCSYVAKSISKQLSGRILIRFGQNCNSQSQIRNPQSELIIRTKRSNQQSTAESDEAAFVKFLNRNQNQSQTVYNCVVTLRVQQSHEFRLHKLLSIQTFKLVLSPQSALSTLC